MPMSSAQMRKRKLTSKREENAFEMYWFSRLFCKRAYNEKMTRNKT